MTTSAPAKPINLKWAGAGLGVFVGIAILMMSITGFLIGSSLEVAGTPAERDSSLLWLFGGFYCLVAFAPAAIVGALMGAMLGTFYQAQRQPLSIVPVMGLGAGVGLLVLLLSYGVVRALVGNEWASFLEDYGSTGLLQGAVPYILAVLLGFIGLSYNLNQRLTLNLKQQPTA